MPIKTRVGQSFAKRTLIRVVSRSELLFLYSVIVITYGIGLLSGYHPTFDKVFAIQVGAFGYMFIATGVICLLGILFDWGKVPYALSVSVAVFWACVLVVFWSSPEGFSWVAALSWIFIAATQLLESIRSKPHILHRHTGETRKLEE
jgi:hypothetical protein